MWGYVQETALFSEQHLGRCWTLCLSFTLRYHPQQGGKKDLQDLLCLSCMDEEPVLTLSPRWENRFNDNALASPWGSSQLLVWIASDSARFHRSVLVYMNWMFHLLCLRASTLWYWGSDFQQHHPETTLPMEKRQPVIPGVWRCWCCCSLVDLLPGKSIEAEE